jgi:hypothetical protein
MIEINLLLFAFLVNFVWEMLQMPLFAFPAQASWAQMNLACVQASAGDALMMVIAYWIVAVILKDRAWVFHPSTPTLALFLAPGIVMTIVFEALATGPLHRWAYTAAMPTLPGLGTGLVPLAQWLILPPVILFIVRRQLR